MTSLEWRAPSGAGEPDGAAEHLEALRAETSRYDGVDAFGDPTHRDLAGWTSGTARPTSRGLLARDGDVLVGYAHVDAALADDVIVEAAVTPDARRRGIGGVLADAVLAEYPRARGWAHGDHPGAAALAARHDRSRARELWQMRRPPGPLPVPVVPERVVIGALRVGVDEPEIVEVNNRAFAWHPEQGHWDLEAVAALEREPWFDAAGVLLARDAASGALLGFHWTKIHERSASVPEPLGEVYVIGVDPAAQGRRVGSTLTLAGLHHLAERGLTTVILYVEGDNASAIATYRRLGFARTGVDVSYEPV